RQYLIQVFEHIGVRNAKYAVASAPQLIRSHGRPLPVPLPSSASHRRVPQRPFVPGKGNPRSSRRLAPVSRTSGHQADDCATRPRAWPRRRYRLHAGRAIDWYVRVGSVAWSFDHALRLPPPLTLTLSPQAGEGKFLPLQLLLHLGGELRQREGLG